MNHVPDGFTAGIAVGRHAITDWHEVMTLVRDHAGRLVWTGLEDVEILLLRFLILAFRGIENLTCEFKSSGMKAKVFKKVMKVNAEGIHESNEGKC